MTEFSSLVELSL